MKLVRVDMLEEVGEARANFKGGGIVLGSGENKFSKNSLHDNYNYEEWISSLLAIHNQKGDFAHFRFEVSLQELKVDVFKSIDAHLVPAED